jgi:hypothetical protein
MPKRTGTVFLLRDDVEVCLSSLLCVSHKNRTHPTTTWAYYEPEHLVNHEAHVEAPEVGTHSLSIQHRQEAQLGKYTEPEPRRSKADRRR